MSTQDLMSDALSSVDLQTFRQVMASFASGITVVTTTDAEDVPRGLTCSAFCSVSVDPPLLLNSVASRSGSLKAILERGRFAVNILSSDDEKASNVFASGAPDKFDQVAWEPGPTTGMPLLRGTVAHAECELDNSVVAGDHTLLLGRVVAGAAGLDKLPLTYWRSDYAKLAPGAHAVHPMPSAA
ncbi:MULTISPECIES: flavin reductase family protein [unclassified Streptomyces]|uniref:flavin reductase family protein n=1 Tax=unclassified Streptomyces TaxID=2593676 RepID=UPI0022B5FB98|nr:MULTISPECIES: flavin reductase family protein [unclassified Streptomyces]MCZ7416217.1 flavin reductase family protein [Streptomyces sp. WMMC897]MCZ7433974.1 flavin reductase family protein [Streptomyces sp. WMMC1477]